MGKKKLKQSQQSIKEWNKIFKENEEEFLAKLMEEN